MAAAWGGLTLLLRAAGGALLGAAAAFALAFAWAWCETPDAARIEQFAGPRPLALAEVSPFVVEALLVTEDRRFFEHPGVDLRRLAGAAWASLHGRVQGGSTITQQLARNLFPLRIGRERSLWRKLRELTVALKIERAFGKREILALYLQRVPFAGGVTGIETAARLYFDKPAAALDAPEAALLVAMLKGPQRYDPRRWPERALRRRNLVLKLMGHEVPLPVAELCARPLGLRPEAAAPPEAGAPEEALPRPAPPTLFVFAGAAALRAA